MKHKKLAVVTGLLLAASISLQPVSAGSYGPVKNNDTLWDIASRNRPSYDISVPQMMAAIKAQNPQAFVAGNANLLTKGVYLKIPAMAEAQRSSSKQATQASLQAEISTLRTQLNNERSRSAELAQQLQQLQTAPAAPTAQTTPAEQSQVVKLQTDLVVKLETELVALKQQLQAKDARIAELQAASVQVAALPDTATNPAANPEQTKQADAAMQAELKELKQLLEQRDAHIQNLQASLREASISIKRQYAEAQALHARLKQLEPGNTAAAPAAPAEPGTATPPSLSLEGTEPATQPAAIQPVFTDQTSAPAVAEGNNKPVSLQNMLEQQAPGGSSSTDGKLPTPSRVSLAVALISLMFILALLWRSISQRRALNQEEAQLRASLDGGI